MKETTKGILIGVASGVISTAIVAGVGYVWLVKENQLRIEMLQRDTNQLSSQVSDGVDELDAVKLFVVSAHPDRNAIPLASANKLQRLEPKEIATLSAQMRKYPSAAAFSQRVASDPRLGSLLRRHKIDQNDLQNYWRTTRDLKFTDDHGP